MEKKLDILYIVHYWNIYRKIADFNGRVFCFVYYGANRCFPQPNSLREDAMATAKKKETTKKTTAKKKAPAKKTATKKKK